MIVPSVAYQPSTSMLNTVRSLSNEPSLSPRSLAPVHSSTFDRDMRHSISYSADAATSLSTSVKVPLPPRKRPSNPSPLLDLPAEIRNRIYRSCFFGTTLTIKNEHHVLPVYDYSGCLFVSCQNDVATDSDWSRGCNLPIYRHCRAQHGTATSLLSVSKQIFTEALPVFYQLVDVSFENVDTFENFFHLKSFASVRVLQSRPLNFGFHIPNAFSAIQSLHVGEFVKHRDGEDSKRHKTHQRRLLESIKYSMPQLKCLYLRVNFPSKVWDSFYIPSRFWYLPLLSQLQVLHRFDFGAMNAQAYLEHAKSLSEDLTRRQLAVAYRYVLRELVTRDEAVSQDHLAAWLAIGDSSEIRDERFKMIKSRMADYLLKLDQVQAATKIQSLPDEPHVAPT